MLNCNNFNVVNSKLAIVTDKRNSINFNAKVNISLSIKLIEATPTWG